VNSLQQRHEARLRGLDGFSGHGGASPVPGRMNLLQQGHEARLRGLTARTFREVAVREPYTQLYVHLVWSTWVRLPLLRGDVQSVVYHCIQAECRATGADLIAIGGIEDHVHVLVRMPRTVSVAYLVKQLKGSSSHLVTHRAAAAEALKWQGGYGAFTVSKKDVARVKHYIVRQKEHHRDRTLAPEHELPWPSPA
jgi:putative transposase